MNIRYEFISPDKKRFNEIIEVEVDDYFGEIIMELDHEEMKNNRRETRRHNSYSDDNDKMEVLDAGINIEEEITESIFSELESCNLHKAIAQLNENQQRLVKAIYFDNISVSEYAVLEGVTQSAISQRLATVIKKLKKFLEKS